MKTDLFQSCGHCWVFQIGWHIEFSILTASLFRNWNSPAGIPSPPLAVFIVMLPKSHLTSYSSISGSWWVMSALWFVSNSLRPHGLQPTRLLCPWDFPGKSTGVGCHHLLWPLWLSGSLRFFWLALLCILATSSWFLLLLLGPSYFCPLSFPSLHEIFPWYFQFSWRDLQSFCFFALFI